MQRMEPKTRVRRTAPPAGGGHAGFRCTPVWRFPLKKFGRSPKGEAAPVALEVPPTYHPLCMQPTINPKSPRRRMESCTRPLIPSRCVLPDARTSLSPPYCPAVLAFSTLPGVIWAGSGRPTQPRNGGGKVINRLAKPSAQAIRPRHLTRMNPMVVILPSKTA